MRLTERIIDENGTEHIFTKYVKDNQKLKDEKLCQLEDIEEELGVDLITLFKALKNGKIFVKKGYCVEAGEVYELNKLFSIDNISYDEMTNEELEEFLYYKGFENSWKFTFYVQTDELSSTLYLVNIKDYGKTWALDKKDLTNE